MLAAKSSSPHEVNAFNAMRLRRAELAGNIGGIEITPGFLLAAGALVEIPIAMVLLSRVLQHRANRWANVAAGTTMMIVQLGSLFARTPALYYVFFRAIEIACTVLIVWFAWNWRGAEPARSAARA